MTDAVSYRPGADALKDRIILVTGAGSGVGRALSLACANLAATLVLLGKRKKPLEETYDQIVQAGSPDPLILPLDLGRATPENYQELSDKLRARYGRLDGLVHNAAHFDALTPFNNISAKSWYTTLQVNLSAPYLMTQALLPLLQNAGGRLVFSLENPAQIQRAHWGAYGVSKCALETLFKIIADELEGSGITAGAVNPGPTRTALRARGWMGEDPANNPLPETRIQPYLYLLDSHTRPESGSILSN